MQHAFTHSTSTATGIDDLPPVVLTHLERLTGDFGLYEHAQLDEPRRHLGYTTDDNARALVVIARLPPALRPPSSSLFRTFVASARVAGGWRNRMSHTGDWTERRGSDDAHGRALWGLGTLFGAGEADDDTVAAFLAGLDFRSTHARANAYAALGATAAWRSRALRAELGGFLDRLRPQFVRLLPRSGRWKWPQRRLTYDNARLPEALIALGSAMDDATLVEGGLGLLEWLIAWETGRNGFSFTPTSGGGPADARPAFDQQPIEAWAMADACVAASEADGSTLWPRSLRRSALWLLGANDSQAVLYDAATGAGHDGLEASGVNQNRGAESTLSALGTLLAAGAAAK